MQELQIRVNLEIDAELWGSFVRGHPSGSVFQTKEMYDLFRQAGHNQSLAIAVMNDRAILGVLLAVIVSNGPVITRAFTSRSIVIGGPLAEDNDPTIIDLLFFEYKRRLPRYVVYTEIRPIFDPQGISGTLLDLGYNRIGHYNLLMNITPDAPDLWNRMHKERRRNVRKAQEYGLEFKEVVAQQEINVIIALILKTYKRKRVPISSTDALKKANLFLCGSVRYFAAFYKGEMIAGQIRLYYNDLAYAWYAGSDEKHFKMYPNDFLMWNVICWSHEHGYRVFDFGGGGEPGVPYGVRDYKLKYGCDMHDYGRFLCIHHSFIYKMGKTAISLLGMKK